MPFAVEVKVPGEVRTFENVVDVQVHGGTLLLRGPYRLRAGFAPGAWEDFACEDYVEPHPAARGDGGCDGEVSAEG